jgi:hypothetical protein
MLSHGVTHDVNNTFHHIHFACGGLGVIGFKYRTLGFLLNSGLTHATRSLFTEEHKQLLYYCVYNFQGIRNSVWQCNN